MIKKGKRQSSIATPKQGIELPRWIFEVDEEDEIQGDSSLLEELEIDPAHIYRSILWMLFGPCFQLTGMPNKKHPLHNMGLHSDNRSIDFFGPCSMVSLYSLVLWLGRVRDVPWVFVIWSIAAVMNHFISRVWCKSSLMIHIALLGYSVSPIIPFAAIIVLVNMPIWLATILEMMSILWATIAAVLSYSMILSVAPEHKQKLTLLFPVVILMEIYFISLIPIRH
mmetsp:Transcript_3266/g.5081  ORF Transcript_3266/g.5081 Transcript_3266/m.5081 type:complete len:224 (-) Transcript_3266:1194-1865(-)